MNGSKSYIVAALLVAVGVVHVYDALKNGADPTTGINEVLGGLGIGAVRHGIQKAQYRGYVNESLKRKEEGDA